MKTRGLPQRRFTGPLKPAPLSLGHLTSQPHLPPQGCAGTGGNGSGLACPQRAHSLRRHLKVRAVRDECLRVTVTDALSPCLSCPGSQNPSYLSTTNTHRDAARCQESWGGKKAENIPMPCSVPALLFWPPHRRWESGLPLDPPPGSNCPNARE